MHIEPINHVPLAVGGTVVAVLFAATLACPPVIVPLAVALFTFAHWAAQGGDSHD